MSDLMTLAEFTGNGLVAAYWICMIVGGGLVLVSALGGHGSDASASGGDFGGADVGTDIHGDFGAADAQGAMHGDVDAGAHVGGGVHGHHGVGGHYGAAAISTWFSLRFVVFFVAAFGAMGVVLTYLTPTGPGTTLALSLLLAAAVGQAVHQFFRAIQRGTSDSAPQPGDYIHRLGRVTVRINHPDMGEVAVVLRQGQRFVPAVAVGKTRNFAVGDEAAVVAYRGGVAEVVAPAEFEEYRSYEKGAAK